MHRRRPTPPQAAPPTDDGHRTAADAPRGGAAAREPIVPHGPRPWCSAAFNARSALRPDHKLSPEKTSPVTIKITHTRREGTLVEGTEKGDKAGKILKRKEYGRPGGLAFRWGHDLQCWYLRHSGDHAADQWTVNKLRGYLEKAVYTVVVSIDDHERRSYAEAEVERIERAEARAERFDGYAGNAASRAEGAYRAAHDISEYMTGEPIKVGHHSERSHRRDIERMDNHMRHGIEESRKASYWADRAAVAEHFEAFRRDPNRTLRRLEKLRKELRDIEKWQRGESAM